jgi:hypothetical protein
MDRTFDYNGFTVSSSKPVKTLKSVKKCFLVDSGDRDVVKFPLNNDFIVYLPRVYENVVAIRLAGAEFPAVQPKQKSNGLGIDTDTLYYLVDIEGLNKTDECSVGADRSGFPDGYFAKIPITDVTTRQLYNDHSAQENIARYTPPISKLDRLRIRMRTHGQKSTADSIYWDSKNFSLSFEIVYLDNVFDDFSSFESRVGDRNAGGFGVL